MMVAGENTVEHYTIPTAFGNLELHFTDGKHVFASTPRGSALTVNRVQYHVGCHIYLWSTGEWQIGNEDVDAYTRRQSLHMTRVDWVKVNDMYPSRAAWDKAASDIWLAVHNFAINNPGIVREAQLEHLRNEYDKAEAASIDAKKAYDQAVLERAQAHDRLMKFRNMEAA